MIEGKKVLGIIPARGGSKRLPRKNVLPLAGKPLITWTIEAALHSQYIDEVFISTDDQEIADISSESGVMIPELRPEHLATDSATSSDVVLYTIDNFGQSADIVVLLQPTSPLRTNIHIDQALELYLEKTAESVVSMTPCEHSPLWSNTLPDDHSMGSFIKPEAMNRSQELANHYRLNGAIYVFDAIKLKQKNKIEYNNKSYAYIMDNQSSIDIDEHFDFLFASFIMSKK